jgi:cytosine permease
MCGGPCLSAAAILSLLALYYAPAMLGMKTGFPVHTLGSSTFGTTGCYLVPGLLMSILLIGWLAVGTFFVTKYILSSLQVNSEPGSAVFTTAALAWSYMTMRLGAQGVRYSSKLSLLVSGIVILAVVVVFSLAPVVSGVKIDLLYLNMAAGFVLSVIAVGMDFGMYRRDELEQPDVRRDMRAITLAMIPLLIAGAALTVNPAIQPLSYTFLLLPIALIAPAAVCVLIAGLSLYVMAPGVTRKSAMFLAIMGAAVLSITGAAADLTAIFTIIGAAFGPAWGAMAADYVMSGKQWLGPRLGINVSGCTAWVLGLCVGILPLLPLSFSVKAALQPAAAYSFATGFVVYILLARIGLQPRLMLPRRI